MSASGYLSSRRIAANAMVNAAGFLLLALVMFFTYPHLLSALGAERMGVFLLLITIIGYFSIFDLGINRAMVRFLAKYEAEGEKDKLRSTFVNGMMMLFTLGVIATLVMFFLAPLIVTNAEESIVQEAGDAIRISSFSMILLLLNAGLRALLESRQQFITINLIMLPASSLNYLLSYLIAFWGGDLRLIAIYLLCGRLVVLLIFYTVIREDGDKNMFAAPVNIFGSLEIVRYGGWFTVTRLLSSAFLYLDRFVLGISVSLAAITYYATPFELSLKLLVLAQTFILVLFPAYSALEKSNPRRYQQLRITSMKVGVLIKACTSAGVVIIAAPFLSWWISPEFAVASAPVMQILALGFFCNYAANFPAATLQACDRVDLLAWINLAELPFYILALYLCIDSWGIYGAAIAWSMRAALDMVALLIATNVVKPLESKTESKRIWVLFLLSIVLLAGALLLSNYFLVLLQSFLIGLLICTSFSILAWFMVLSSSERSFILNLFPKFGRGKQ